MSFKNDASKKLLDELAGKSPVRKKSIELPEEMKPKKKIKRKRVGRVNFNNISFEERNELRLGNYNVKKQLALIPSGKSGTWFTQVALVTWGDHEEEVVDIRKIEIVDDHLTRIGKGITLKVDDFRTLSNLVKLEDIDRYLNSK